MKKKEKIYKVEFIEYTNYTRETVSNWDGEGLPSIADIEYITVGPEPFLVKESALKKYEKFGKGYRNIIFVGYMECD